MEPACGLVRTPSAEKPISALPASGTRGVPERNHGGGDGGGGRARRRLYLNRRGLVGVAVSTDAPRKTRTRSRTERPDNPRDLFLARVSSPLLRRCVGVQHAASPLAPRRTASPARVSRGQKVGVKETIDTACGPARRDAGGGVVIRAGSDREKETRWAGVARRRDRASDGFRVHAYGYSLNTRVR